jgi:hypothetical protein
VSFRQKCLRAKGNLGMRSARPVVDHVGDLHKFARPKPTLSETLQDLDWWILRYHSICLQQTDPKAMILAGQIGSP